MNVHWWFIDVHVPVHSKWFTGKTHVVKAMVNEMMDIPNQSLYNIHSHMLGHWGWFLFIVYGYLLNYYELLGFPERVEDAPIGHIFTKPYCN